MHHLWSFFGLIGIHLLLLYTNYCIAQPQELGDDFLKRDPYQSYIVKFYAPWCGHCRSMEPAYAELAQLLKDSPIRVGRIDATAHQMVASTFHIRGFPTIMFIKGETNIEYRGERSASEMAKFVNRVSGDAVKRIASPGKFNEIFPTCSTDPFFLFVGSQDSEQFAVYKYIAGQMRADSTFYQADSDLLPRLPISIDSMRLERKPMPLSEPAVLVFKDNGCIMFPGNFDNDSLGVWINDERYLLFPQIGDFLFYSFYPITKMMMVLITNSSDRASSEQLIESGRRLALAMHPELSGVQLAWTESLKAACDLAMTSLPAPNVILMNPNTTKYYLRQNYSQPMEEKSVDSLKQLAIDALDNKLLDFGGGGIFQGLKRTAYDFITGLVSFIIGHPGLALIVVGAPIGVISILCYAICCMDSDGDEEEASLQLTEAEDEEEEDGEGREEEEEDEVAGAALGDSAAPETKKDL